MTTEVLAQPSTTESEHTNGDSAVEAQPDAGVNEQPEDNVVRLYFVRIPRPQLDDAERQRLQTEFQAHLTELKGINARLAAKRDVVKNLRSQMLQAKSLKGSAQPEFEDKLNRLKQLRDLRASYIADVSAIKNKVKGLECRTEQELDAKIKAEEERIRFGSVTLREEKMIVNEISKLRAQRDKIKEYELEKSRLVELESNIDKVKAAAAELEGEFSIIKGERDAASKVMSDFYDQLKAAEKEASKVEEEQKEAAERKNEAHEALEAVKREVDASMLDYRENRKFSLQIRDLVANGDVEAAQQLCCTQVDELLARLGSDSAFRSEYHKLAAETRRYPVSDLLPESSSAAAAAAASAAPGSRAGGKGGRGGKDAAPATAPVKLVPRGKEKAQELIASIMQKASAEAATRRLAAPQAFDNNAADEPEVAAAAAPEAPRPVVAAKPVAPPKHVENPAAKAAEVFNFKVEVPKLEEVEFVPPVIKSETETLSKEQIREEQARKAAEAEARKKKRADASAQKKVKAIEAQKRSEEEERAARARAAQEAARAAAAPPAQEAEAGDETVAVPERAVAAPASRDAPSASKAAVSAPGPKLLGPAAKRPAGKAGLLRKLKKFYQANQVAIVVAAFVALILFILIIASFY